MPISSSSSRSTAEGWDFMLPCPASRSNGGCCDSSAAGLLAYGAGSSIVVVDIHSSQLVSVLPMPSPSNTTFSPFITALRWAPHPLRHDFSTDPTLSHLCLAVGDLQGRIALCDVRTRQLILWFDSIAAGAGIQDLCWLSDARSTVLASISGPSLLSLWHPISGRCFWKYDASPEYLSCIRRDPFDARHFCSIGLRGFLLSATVHSDRYEDDVVLREHLIPVVRCDSFLDRQRIEKETAASPSAPALAAFPTFFVRCGFSLQWRHILFVTFPRELVVFDLQYGSALSSMGFPRGWAKFMDVLPDLDLDLIYCIHIDGKLSIWRRKEGEQSHMICTMEELIPGIGNTVPSPSILTVVSCESQSAFQNVAKRYSDTAHASFCDPSVVSPNIHRGLQVLSETYLISLSDDGKIWRWLLTVEGKRPCQNAVPPGNADINHSRVTAPDTDTAPMDFSADRLNLNKYDESEPSGATWSCVENVMLTKLDLSFKVAKDTYRIMNASSSNKKCTILFREDNLCEIIIMSR